MAYSWLGQSVKCADGHAGLGLVPEFAFRCVSFRWPAMGFRRNFEIGLVVRGFGVLVLNAIRTCSDCLFFPDD